ncbi:uncharacterized protein Tco_0972760 [Tanacetum coccineum]
MYIKTRIMNELEAAYVAQICLTWEALNWNYNYFQQLRASRRESDPGCPAYIAQQFQQFQVVLQRYIENEPYQNDSDDEKKDEYLGSRISSESFLGNEGQIHGVKLLIAGNSYSSNLELPMSSKFVQHKLLPVHDTKHGERSCQTPRVKLKTWCHVSKMEFGIRNAMAPEFSGIGLAPEFWC